MTTSTHGSKRQRRREKAAADQTTQQLRWIQFIRDQVADGFTPRQGLDHLAAAIPAWIDEIPCRKAQRRDAWNDFIRHVRTVTTTTP